MSFTGFPPDTPRFLADLAANNERSWFEANRARYEAAYVEPAKEFVAAAGERIGGFAHEIVADPRINGSVFRINRDVRFSRDKTPYKENVDFWFWEGERRGAVSGLFVRVAADLVGIGAGCHGFERERLEAYRQAVADPTSGEELAALVTSIQANGYEVNEPGYKRLPRGLEAHAGTSRENSHATTRSTCTSRSPRASRSTGGRSSTRASDTGGRSSHSTAGSWPTCSAADLNRSGAGRAPRGSPRRTRPHRRRSTRSSG